MAKKKTVSRKKKAAKKAAPKKTLAKKTGKPAKVTAQKKKSARLKDATGKVLQKIGEVIHYFPKAKAAAVRLTKLALAVGDSIYIKGHTTDFKQTVVSMQLDCVVIKKGKKGDEIGLLVRSRVRIGDSVYKV